MLDSIFKRLLDERTRQRLRRWLRPARFGTLRRTTPLSDEWGIERGTPVDRFYIEDFLDQHRGDICGRVLEVRDRRYTNRFGTGVLVSEVLDIDPANPLATVLADLSAAEDIPSGRYDCFILTQTLQYVRDLPAALHHAGRILRPGGVLLATVPCLSRIQPRHGLETDLWRLTPASCRMQFEAAFGEEQVEVVSYGNVLSAVAFLAGAVQEDLTRTELEVSDPYYPLILAVRAVKAAGEDDH